MKCSCFSSDNDDYVTILASTHKRAAKHHRCNECLGVIFPGQTYLDERYVFDGKASTHKTCSCCVSVRDNLLCAFTYGAVWFELRDHIYHAIHYEVDGVPWSRLAKLTPAARTHVLLMVEDIWAGAYDNEDEE